MGPADICRIGISGQEAEDPPGAVPGTDGRPGPLATSGGANQARVPPRPGKGRRPYPLAVMLRIHCVQLFYNLSDPGVEDLLYEAESVRRLVGLKLSGDLPDETTILNFRHLLERHSLGEGLLQEINAHLESQGLRLREGTIVDASIIEAPSSTKNLAGERDPEMHQTKKGNQWHFGDESSHRGGRGHGSGAQHEHHSGQRP